MKRQLKSNITFAAISVMVLSSAISVNAEVVTEGNSYTFFTRDQESRADGYMLTNTSTPGGYFVNADGI